MTPSTLPSAVVHFFSCSMRSFPYIHNGRKGWISAQGWPCEFYGRSRVKIPVQTQRGFKFRSKIARARLFLLKNSRRSNTVFVVHSILIRPGGHFRFWHKAGARVMEGGFVSLHNFPRWDAQPMQLSFPFRRSDGYEFCVPPVGVPLIQSKRGTSKRMSCIRNKATGKFLPVHPTNTEGDQFYWFVSLWDKGEQYSVNVAYSRVCAWVLCLPEGVGPVEFCTDYVVHHHKKLRIAWKGDRIWVNNDQDTEDWVLESRADHAKRHLLGL